MMMEVQCSKGGIHQMNRYESKDHRWRGPITITYCHKCKEVLSVSNTYEGDITKEYLKDEKSHRVR